MNATERKTFQRVKTSQEKWKAKAIERNTRLRAAKLRIRDLEKSRQMWRERAGEDTTSLDGEESSSRAVHSAVLPSPPNFRFLLVSLCIHVTVNCAVSFRAVPKILTGIQQLLRACGLTWEGRIPHFTTVIRWTLRLGAYLLNRAITHTVARWICVIDHTIQVGTSKACVILRVPVDVLTAKQALTLKDVEVLYLKVQATWNGTEVQKVLEHVFSHVGSPVQIVVDGGSDLQRGLKNVVAGGRFGFKVTSDITHLIANLLKHTYQKHARFTTLLTTLSTTKSKILQTSLAYLSPLKERTKSRFLNLPGLAKWTQQMRRYLNALSAESPSDPATQAHQEQVQTYFAWLHDYQDLLTELWTELHALLQIQHVVKTAGVTDPTMPLLRMHIQTISDATISEPLHNYLKTELTFRTQVTHPTLLTSDIIESLFGKYKYLAKPHSLSEINRMIFAVPCVCAEITPELVSTAFSSISNRDAEQQYHQELPETLLSKRRKAFRTEANTQPVLDVAAITVSPSISPSQNVTLHDSIASEYDGQKTVGIPSTRTG